MWNTLIKQVTADRSWSGRKNALPLKRSAALRVESHGCNLSRTWRCFHIAVLKPWSHSRPFWCKKMKQDHMDPSQGPSGVPFFMVLIDVLMNRKWWNRKLHHTLTVFFCRHTKIWLVVWIIWIICRFHIWDVILPIDFHTFQDGWNHQPAIYCNFNWYIHINYTISHDIRIPW